MSAKQTGLGKGFDSLLPKNFDDSLLLSSADKVEKIPVEKLTANKFQPRKEFDENGIQELAASVKRYGILQPIIATKTSDGYMIIAGERRWRAARSAGLKEVPAILRSTKELEQLELALIENVQRVDLSPLEQAASIEYLHEQLGSTYEAVAQRLGKATSTVHNIVRLLLLPDHVAQALRDRKITEGHARAILALKGQSDKQDILLDNIIAHGWSVRQAEQFAVSVKEGFRETNQTRERMRTETPETKRLAKRFGTKVSIRRMAKGGKIEIAFTSDDQLAAIMEQLG